MMSVVAVPCMVSFSGVPRHHCCPPKQSMVAAKAPPPSTSIVTNIPANARSADSLHFIHHLPLVGRAERGKPPTLRHVMEVAYRPAEGMGIHRTAYLLVLFTRLELPRTPTF